MKNKNKRGTPTPPPDITKPVKHYEVLVFKNDMMGHDEVYHDLKQAVCSLEYHLNYDAWKVSIKAIRHEETTNPIRRISKTVLDKKKFRRSL